MRSRVLLALLVFFSMSYAIKAAYPKHRLGVGVSNTSGSGLSYNFELNSDFVFQLNGIALYYGDNPPDEVLFAGIVGGEIQFNINRTISNRLYITSGFSYTYLKDNWTKSRFINDRVVIEKYTELNRIKNFGIGFGYEYYFTKTLSSNIYLGYNYQISGQSMRFSKFLDYNPNGKYYNTIGIGFGIRILL